MTKKNRTIRVSAFTAIGIAATVALVALSSAETATAASVLNGPIALGTSSTYGALAGSSITNTGTTTVIGGIGVDPGSSVTGFSGPPNGSFTGAENVSNSAALRAKNDLTTAYNDAAGLTPQASGLANLDGMSLTPGVYSGGALSLSNGGILTLAGTSATSVWVFQASSSLTIGSATQVVITGGASACNVFWQVGSSASLGTSAAFQGTILAAKSITASTDASVIGRLLAGTGDVTLQSNAITVPTACAAGSRPSTSPTITSHTLPSATAGTPYSFRVLTSGTPTPTFAMTGGALPGGLGLDSASGVISGTPTTTGTSSFTIRASNGVGVPVTATLAIVTTSQLAMTGVDAAPPLALGGTLLGLGVFALLIGRRFRAATVRSRS